MNKIIRAASIAASVAAALFIPSQLQAAAPAAPQGFITAKEFLDIGGGVAVADLTNNAKFPNAPDGTYYPPRFEWPTGEDDATPPPGNVKNSYGVQVIGYFYPPTTGQYRFAIASDDGSALYLSTDSNPANKVQIAQEPVWNPVRAWDQVDRRTQVDVGTPDERYNNQSKPITLTANTPYYIEALMKEGGGGDNVAVAYRNDGTWPQSGDLPILGSQLSTIDKTSGPVSITTQPASQTVLEGVPVSFTVVADGTPPYGYQWKKGGTDILDATNVTYSIAFASAADAGQYTVVVSGGQGTPVTSAPATLTVSTDNVKPTIVQVSGSGDFRHVTVKYSERIDEASATNSANYAITGGVTVSSGRLQNDTTVVLTTSVQVTATTYTLTVNNVKDRAFVPNVIVANTAVQFSSAQLKSGLANWERWNDNGTGDTTPIDVFAASLLDPTFRGPDVTGVSTYLGAPRNIGLDNYGVKAYCYFIAPATANYVFFEASDDQGYLYLSTDNNPANKKLIAAQPSWSDQNQWLDPDLDRTMGAAQNASDQFDASEWPTPNVISLTQGTQYYVELVFHEGGGGDGGEVTYKLVTDADPVNGDAPKMTGTVIGSYVDPAVLPPVITQKPVGTNFNKGANLTFTVGVDSTLPVTYQWAKNRIAIPGPAGTNATLTIPNADHTAIGDYSVTVANANGSANSLPDDGARAFLKGGFVIEAEDFNFASGQTKPEASVMPYLGNAYTNITSQVVDVDYFNTADESGGAAVSYSRFAASDPAVVDMKGPADPADYNRGDFNVTANYAIGWTDAGEWQNYTRTFPAGNYVIYGGIAFGGTGAADINQFLSVVANPAIADGSQPGVEGKLQGLTKIGSFIAPGTGNWSSNDMIPLKDDTGNVVQIALSGTKTIRWSANKADGDMDFLVFYNVGNVVVGPKLSIAASPTGAPVITYEGTLESEGSIPGTWGPVTGATSPYTVTPSGTQQFYRAKQ